jgi:FixJ family two-component response regulator
MGLTQVILPQSAFPAVPKFSPIVCVIDDDIFVRTSLERLIRREGWQPETFQSADEFLARPRPLVPNCLILDLPLPDANGLEVQKRIARERGETPIIVISDFGDIPATVEAMKAGAADFLEKPFSHDILLLAIRQSLERSRAVLDAELKVQHLHNCYTTLTPREEQVMALVVFGLLNKQIGGELGISEITVKKHRGQVMKKMEANSLPDLVRMASKLGSVYPPIQFA